LLAWLMRRNTNRIRELSPMHPSPAEPEVVLQ